MFHKDHTDSGGALSNQELNNFQHKYSNREVLSNSDNYSELRDIINKPQKDGIERAGSAHLYAGVNADSKSRQSSKV